MNSRMLLILSALVAILACGGSGGTDVPPTWNGSWRLSSVDGTMVPATSIRSGITYRVVSRTLLVLGTGASWLDSTTVVVGGTEHNQSGAALLDVLLAGETMTVMRRPVYGGAVPPVMTFVRRSDGTVTSSDQGTLDVYRKD